MGALHRFEQRLTGLLEVIITVFFFVILGLTIALVILRYGFNSSITGGNEAMEYLFIYTTALGAAVSVGKGEHINISFLVDKLPPTARRRANRLNYLLIGFVNGVMLWYSPNWIGSTGYFESPVMRIPNWVVQVSVPLGSGLVIVYCLNHILMEMSGPPDTPEPKVNP